ncbi:4-diphosphocytidyl-2-C-methyl-D-erythritol kinase [Tissierella praeacuta DSM 18095]|uniref:4-diphosphocytidyl-2-C-methyl-D-erythritol kinase n=1 Tax=Tissierella praeacuta DSM 18095 TaxID=1123404 RepID=A0A1M4XSU3_9FIRM|nr:4-(cytidine 5'-diphospho)-2-C-methyl-D-erythritol kinase [Tissierella praeacuta]TCU79202.1 4-diphosphocytidyl-2-C-methyl-D-erythritol kinase [Tissierella praeacuta]SHE96541.1 4-diphosphocytidyl-2-C-methyl-D-erythritol kinase [Tissierella praeacuta DSM 18095]SUO99175.1 4-diphosphocytidyl-2-C-methyl-D-erythritol kinase [Tissierella praeacuta]
MKEIIINSYGKINLGLDVLYRRDDGYHEINTIMQQISLNDILTIKEIKKDIEIECNKEEVPLDSTNLVYHAWKKMQEKTGINRGIKVNIYKRIPVAAGLAGGSANAAAVLKGLNELWGLKLSEKELMEIGVEIGADVPYCIMGGTAFAEGIGEKLTKIRSFKDKNVLLINPGIGISTAEVYKNIRLNKQSHIDIKKIMSFIEEDDINSVAKSITNVMEEVVIEKTPIISEIKRDMLDYGALGSLMSGSGPTVFGLFEDLDKLQFCKKSLEKKYNKGVVLIVKTI